MSPVRDPDKSPPGLVGSDERAPRTAIPARNSGAGLDRLSSRRYTLMLVPDGARSGIRQVTISLTGLRALVTVSGLVVALAVVGVTMLISSMVQGRAQGNLLEENLALKARLSEIEGKLDQVDSELRRLRLYDTQLQDVPPEALPGWGPLDVDDLDAAAWAGFDLPDDSGRDAAAGEFGDPLGEAGMDESPVIGGSAIGTEPADWADSLVQRTEATLEDLLAAEHEVGQLVENAEHWRAMQSALPNTWPVEGVLTSGFGYRRSPFTKRLKFHRGLDISAPPGTPILAPASGVIITAEWNSGYGRMVEIDHGFGIVSRYAHSSRVYVEVGDEIARGDVIATIGMTGRTTGPHLHYEVYVDGRPVDPMEYLDPDP